MTAMIFHTIRPLAVVALAAVFLQFRPADAVGDDTPTAKSTSTNAAGNFAEKIAPFLKAHCVDCHGGDDPEGGIGFDRYVDSSNVQKDYDLWEKVIRLVNEHQMPPADEPQPSTEEIIALSAAIETELSLFDCSAEKHPGRVRPPRARAPILRKSRLVLGS